MVIIMKKFLNNLFFGKATSILFFFIAAVSILLDYSMRSGYVFIDKALFGGFCMTLFVLAVTNSALLVYLACCKMKSSEVCDRNIFKAFQVISKIYAGFYFVISVVKYAVSGAETNSAAVGFIKEMLPVWLAAVLILSALFIVANIRKSAVKKAVSVMMALVLAFGVYAAVFPVTPFDFTSAPVVFDNGEGYSVVFSTNDKATANITYRYQGEDIVRYDEDNGRKNSSVIHTIKVPYQELSQNTYKVSATRVIDELGYGGLSGKTIESEEINFNDKFDDTINVLTVSDWHTHNDLAKQTISKIGAYDALVLLGDGAPGFNFQSEVVKYILSFASDLSRGEMPVLFARGNHETRGREAANLSSYLGMDKFYYSAKLGDYRFIVLDSGEDKEDSHIEYGSMVAYEQHRKNMVEWLGTQENPNHEKLIALSHSNEICIEEELSKTAHSRLDALNTSLLVSGHTHTNEFLETSPYPTLIDGGINADGNKTYIASKLTLSDEKIEIVCVSSSGGETIHKTVNWR